MFSKVISSTIIGDKGFTVYVEVDIKQGLPSFDIVGLPDSAVKESKERVRSAITNSGYAFPIRKITINLAPGDIRKEGPSFDLPIAVGILTAMNILNENEIKDYIFTGELSLDGMINSVSGVLPIVLSAKDVNITKCIVPYNNRIEASLVDGIEVYGVKNLIELIDHFKGKKINQTITDIEKIFKENKDNYLDFEDVKGQHNVKRAIEIAASGNHNILLIGPPGSGKTMLAKRIPSILPKLTFEECIEVTKIFSISSLLKNKDNLLTTRPFRSPHHTSSDSSLVGGGRIPKPGEISLAHNGLLFLDELPEFSRRALEVLRQPLEDKFITVSRVNGIITYPANFMLVASMNPCPCGYYGSDNDKCKCTSNEINRYLGKISGPLLDRIDIHVESTQIKYDDLSDRKKSEESKYIRERVLKAREIQRQRYKNELISSNSELTAPLIEKYCVINDRSRDFLKDVFNRLNFSARGYHKLLKLARTIADLKEEEFINEKHISEAISLRSLDRKYWL